MALYHCTLTLHDNVFFATREMGILYETEKYLHNWGLSFALFNVNYIPQLYRLQGELAQKPTYLDASAEQNLLHLNQAGIYVFPAQPINWSYQINTFKAAQVGYYGKSKQFGDKGADKNYPINYGKAKELAVGSQYRTYILAPETIKIPRWIRLGKWASKIRVKAIKIPDNIMQNKSGDYTCLHPLNLVSQAQLSGDYLLTKKDDWLAFKSTLISEDCQQLPEQIHLPKGVFYGAGNV
jgi:CRISPR-associated protein Csc1